MTSQDSTSKGWNRQRSADQHAWDDHPHVVWDGIAVEDIELADILSSTLQITGIALAEHRGKPAYRFDVENVASGGAGRLVFTKGQILCDVKRYVDEPPALRMTAAQAATLGRTYSGLPTSVSSTVSGGPAVVGGLTPAYFVHVARAWVTGIGEADSFEDDEQVLFAFLCQAIEGYCHLDADTPYDGPRERWNTLEALAENLTPGIRLVGVDAS